MTSQPSGIPAVVRALAPFRRRITALVVIWVGASVAAGLFGVSASVPLIAALLLALAATGWFAVDHYGSNHLTMWPLTDGLVTGSERGNDFRVTNLANRLEHAQKRGEGRPELVKDLHSMLSLVIRERLNTKHGFTIEDEPRLAEGVIPTELWDFLVSLPPPDLYRPERLDPILRRIEQW